MKHAVITGASSGIGRAIAKSLQADGWKVIAPPHSQLDLADFNQTSQTAADIAEEYMRIDALIHVAGIWHDKEQAHANKDLEDFSAEQIAHTMAVGVTGFMILAAKLLPKMPKDGVVVGVSGTFQDGASGWLPYYTSKRALEDFLIGLAQDYPIGPKVYGISPADTATPAYAKFYPEDLPDAQPPEAIATLVHQLLGESAGYNSGSIIELRKGVTSAGYHT